MVHLELHMRACLRECPGHEGLLALHLNHTLPLLPLHGCSAQDTSVPPHLRGKYLAFVPERVMGGSNGKLSAGLEHMRKLREAGLNHVHLLPCYDFGSVPERVEEQWRVKVGAWACTCVCLGLCELACMIGVCLRVRQ